MVAINEIIPSRFRAGDTVRILGAAFSPTFGDNAVSIGFLAASIVAESATELTVTVPGGVTEDSYVGVRVQRTDTFDNDAVQAYSKPALADVRDGTFEVPGQVPGEVEAADASPQPDAPQAQDYERMATQAEFYLHEALATVGDLLASDGATVAPFGVGAAGQVLSAAPAAAEGLAYTAPVRVFTWSWGKRIDAGAANNGPMVANGGPDNPSVADGEHGVPVAGTLRQVTVLVQAFVAGDTLDQVQVAVNGIVVHDSGAALGLTTFYQAALALVVVVTDRVEVRAFKAGVVGIMRLRAKVVL